MLVLLFMLLLLLLVVTLQSFFVAGNGVHRLWLLVWFFAVAVAFAVAFAVARDVTVDATVDVTLSTPWCARRAAGVLLIGGRYREREARAKSCPKVAGLPVCPTAYTKYRCTALIVVRAFRAWRARVWIYVYVFVVITLKRYFCPIAAVVHLFVSPDRPGDGEYY